MHQRPCGLRQQLRQVDKRRGSGLHGKLGNPVRDRIVNGLRVLLSSAFPARFGTTIRYQFQRTYDAILASPVDTEEQVAAEALWIAPRAGVYGCVPLRVAMAFGLELALGMLTVPLIAFLAGFGWVCFGVAIAGFASSTENFSYVISAVLTPLFLVAGMVFPLRRLAR